MSSSSPLLHSSSSTGRRATALSDLEVITADILWNIAVVIVSALILANSLEERPTEPLRVWIFGYGFECLTQVVLILCMYWSKRKERDSETGYSVEDHSGDSKLYKISSKLSTIHDVISSIWWTTGLILIIKGGFNHFAQAPILYWWTVFFVVIVVVLPIVSACVGFLGYFSSGSGSGINRPNLR